MILRVIFIISVIKSQRKEKKSQEDMEYSTVFFFGPFFTKERLVK